MMVNNPGNFWGAITGTLANQGDLTAALAAKQDTLVSGTNIKTINGSSVLGSGDLVVGGAAAWGSITGTLSDQTDLQTALDAKAAKSANLSDLASASTAFSNIKQAATTTATGVVELATDGESAANLVPQANDARLSNARTPTAHATSHQSGGSDAIKLDDFAAPDDNTDLNASTTAHGLMQKYPGGTSNFLRADGNFAAPTATAADPLYAPGSFTVVTESSRTSSRRLKFTGSQRATIQGTGCLRIT